MAFSKFQHSIGIMYPKKITSKSIRGRNKGLSRKMYFLKKIDMPIILHWPLWGLCYLSIHAEIFWADFTIFFNYECQVWMSALKSARNICTVTLIAQSSQRLHSSPSWYLKDIGHIYFFSWNIFLRRLFSTANWGES